MSNFEGYKIKRFFEDGYFVSGLMEALIICECGRHTTRSECKNEHLAVDDLIDLIDENKIKEDENTRTGTSYDCPDCGQFLRYDNDLKLELEGNEDIEIDN